MKSMLDLQISVLEESGRLAGVSTLNDRKTIIERFEDEGEEFLTITLPSIVKDLYKALDDKKVSDALFRPFKRPKREKLPVFLGGFFRILFEPRSGELRDVLDDRQAAIAIRSIVQISGLCGKLFEQCNPKRTNAAMAQYIANDDRVRDWELFSWNTPEVQSHLHSMKVAFHVMFGAVMHRMQEDLVTGNILPFHGPGATANKLLGNKKWQMPQWPDRLDEVFPYGEYFYNSWSNYLEEVTMGRLSEPGAEIPSRVTSVPKTQKTPRIIAIEPSWNIYIQQGLRRSFESGLKGIPFEYIGYRDQTINQRLAREGSISGSLATLDMSDASDMVSNRLVKYLLADWPDLSKAVQASRSRFAAVKLQDGDVERHLWKFASMGSALCFPFEAMVFCTAVLVGIRKSLNSNAPYDRLIRDYRGRVRVYGDDIVVPTDSAQSVVDSLTTLGLKVNLTKSFWSGNFRESCGKEYWKGYDVSYVKLRHRLPDQRKALKDDVEATVHTVALRNNLYFADYQETVAQLDDLLFTRLSGVYPEVSPTSAALGRHTRFSPKAERMHHNLYEPQVRAYRVVAKSPLDKLEGIPALRKTLFTQSELPNPDEEHLIRAGRPLALRLKQGWLRTF